MFTGIIEDTGKVIAIQENGQNKTFRIQAAISSELKIDQSVSHNGICLTVVALGEDWHEVTAIQETLDLTAAKSWKLNDLLNIERAAQIHARLDGHIVQGHVDSTAKLLEVEDEDGSWRFTFQFDEQFAPLIISKGSICIDGVSLTVIAPTRDSFQVAIIPYTYEHTRFQSYQPDAIVNLEFDIIGKYILRSERLKQGLY